MLNGSQRDLVGKRIFVLQLIVAALVTSLVFAIGFFFLIGSNPTDDPLISYIGFAMASMMVVAWFFVTRIISSFGRKSISKGSMLSPGMQMTKKSINQDNVVRKLLLVYGMQLVVGCALLEGAAFMNALLYLIDGQIISLIISASLTCIIASQFPTRSHCENWISIGLQEIVQMKKI